MDTNPKGEENVPEKYIRTFQSDMATLEEGRMPNLAPFSEEATPEERLVAASPFEKPEVPQAPEVIEAPAPAAPTGPTPIKTYSGDFQDRVKETRASTASILAAEGDVARASAPVAAQKRKNILTVVLSLILIAVGGAGVTYAYLRYQAAHAPVPVAPAPKAPIFVDSTEELSGTGKELLAAVAASAQKPLSPGTVRLLTLASSTVATTTNVFLSLGLPAPSILLRNVDPDGGMTGVLNTTSGESPFFILAVTAYSPSFSGMLSWEPAMQGDLAMLFPMSPLPQATTATSTQPAMPPSFSDDAVQNHNVRVLKDAAGKSIMLYGYWNPSTLVIARDPAAFIEILNRLATSHVQ